MPSGCQFAAEFIDGDQTARAIAASKSEEASPMQRTNQLTTGTCAETRESASRKMNSRVRSSVLLDHTVDQLESARLGIPAFEVTRLGGREVPRLYTRTRESRQCGSCWNQLTEADIKACEALPRPDGRLRCPEDGLADAMI